MADRRAELERLAREAGGDWLAVAQLARALVLAARADLVLDVGVGPGIVTLWLADAVDETGGHLVVLERDPAAIERLAAHVDSLGLAERVQVLHGDAHRTIRTIAGTIAFVRLAADRAGYADYLRQLLDRLRPGAVIMAEGVRAPGAESFRAALAADERFTTVELPFRGGCLLAIWWPERHAVGRDERRGEDADLRDAQFAD